MAGEMSLRSLSPSEEYDENGETIFQPAGPQITRSPRGTFGIRWAEGCYISKLHAEAETGKSSPGVGDYKLLKPIGVDKRHAHFLTAPQDMIPTKFEGKAFAEACPSTSAPGPKYNPDTSNSTARAPTHIIGTSQRPPLNPGHKGPGPGAYTPFNAPTQYPPEYSFGNAPDQDRFATNQYQGALAQKSVPVLETPGPVYELRKNPAQLSKSAGPFDHADRFGPLKHLMISDEHNKRMGEAKGDYPAPNQYSIGSFTDPRKPVNGEKEAVYRSGEAPRFAQNVYGGPGSNVGKGLEGNGPGSFVPRDTNLKTNGPKIPRAARSVGTGKDALSQVPGPGAYKPPLSHGHQGGRPAFGLKRFPKGESMKTPGPIYDTLRSPGGASAVGTEYDKPSFTVPRATRTAKVYISKRHTQDVVGLDSPGAVCCAALCCSRCAVQCAGPALPWPVLLTRVSQGLCITSGGTGTWARAETPSLALHSETNPRRSDSSPSCTPATQLGSASPGLAPTETRSSWSEAVLGSRLGRQSE
eukprot:TRINITY_DN7217_c0_g1_i3.p1 TRINITY_DN7217_c0_g1~~TRINITY_DN7217_c0_g1_i3.p1  ORF type:complete len:526 (-),score=75.98 TRINITY_DN7217_c0_g1_i3:197-1774(-)